ncbi:hypothetical protein P280DRAFT_15590 [Massarina eburnea CBS 473.64]|uniref:Uncharacterized protein n=1 Tax=Massarina eburnea CBS 473.64 TaxID=1395130 RepID=A0A6A6SJS2_9PLEO|nr:hypothetical protein P280DRAFT_15590 [Massarina eburnea CBS 473.64]
MYTRSPPRGNLHAHPSPDAACDRLRLASVSIDVSLQGWVPEQEPADICCPKVLRSPFDSASPVNHLDVISCWKGLSYIQSCEITMWERLHHRALSKQVSEGLRMTLLRELASSSDNRPFISRLVDTVSSDSKPRFIDIDIDHLVHDMLSLLYMEAGNPGGPDAQLLPAHTWFASHANLPAMVINFLRTRDCYLHVYPRTYVEVNLNWTPTHNSSIKILCEVNWQPPCIGFPDLPTMLSPGEEYRIKPEYALSSLGARLGYTMFPEGTEYQISSDTLPFKWDHELCCFRASTPSFIHSANRDKSGDIHASARNFLLKFCGTLPSPHPAETLLTGRLTTTFPDNVRFERTSRYKIKLTIIEPELPERLPRTTSTFLPDIVSEIASKSPSEEESGETDATYWEFPPSAARMSKSTRQAWETKASTSNTPLSPPGANRGGAEGSKIPTMPISTSAFLMERAPDAISKVMGDHKGHLIKRKASKQLPSTGKFDVDSTFASARLALDRFEHLNLELTTKRQKPDQQATSSVHMQAPNHPQHGLADDAEGITDDESWAKRELDSLGDTTTMSTGYANTYKSHSAVEPTIWGEKEMAKADESLEHPSLERAKTKSRAYEAIQGGLKVMPSLKKRGSVRRMRFQHAKRKAMASEEAITKRRDSGVSLSPPMIGPINSVPIYPSREMTSDSASDNSDSSLHSQGKRRETYPLHSARKEQDEVKAKSTRPTDFVSLPMFVEKSNDIGSTDESGSPPWSALSQAAIQKNFEEFQRMAAEKKHRNASAGQLAFERVFLQCSESSDGESWDTDELSEVLEDVHLED